MYYLTLTMQEPLTTAFFKSKKPSRLVYTWHFPCALQFSTSISPILKLFPWLFLKRIGQEIVVLREKEQNSWGAEWNFVWTIKVFPGIM